ncbi:hypothetical protein OG401_14275 [Kitasatospora purpeofusca]|uniref:hypothetical protein n=1 Tax=Kitasatospora purpeofusca TaxID=67352 RepID=UPI0022598F2E|nr:hypothetical protein [Kitasatospora purpeofusca]MCX4685465.1 hypothetical protein [Kitasatospora purpeofusca]
MPEPENTPSPESTTPPETPPADAPEVEKWKALSRQNEQRWKTASKELEDLKAAAMSDQEKALADARTEGRQAALSEVGTSLAKAEIRVQAATAGVTVPTEYLDLNRFLAEDGQADAEKVKSFIETLPKPSIEPAFPELQGAGYHRGAGSTVTSMDPSELADLIAGGRFI